MPINTNVAAPISAPLNLTEDTAGISLQVGTPPTLSGQATMSMALTFGYDTGSTPHATPGFFVQPATITEGVSLSASGFNATSTLGAADATVTGGSAAVSAAETLQIKDPVAAAFQLGDQGLQDRHGAIESTIAPRRQAKSSSVQVEAT